MTLSISVPDGLEPALARRLEHDARVAIAVRLYQEARLSHGEFAAYLGIDRAEADTLLADNGITDYTTGRIEQESAAIAKRLGL